MGEGPFERVKVIFLFTAHTPTPRGEKGMRGHTQVWLYPIQARQTIQPTHHNQALACSVIIWRVWYCLKWLLIGFKSSPQSLL
jgi:hypothetical protein